MMKYIAMIVAMLMASTVGASETKIGKDAIAYTVCIEGHLFVVVEKDTYNSGGVAITQVYKNNAEYGPTAAPVPVECEE